MAQWNTRRTAGAAALLVLVLASAVSAAVAGTSGRRVHLEADVAESVLQPKPSVWADLGAVAADELVQLTFALKQGISYAEMEARVLAVATPSSPAYGQYMSLKEVSELVAPTAETTAVVEHHLALYGATSIKAAKTRDFISADFTAEAASALLGVSEFRRFVRHADQLTLVRATSHYSLPEELAAHVDFVGGVNRFPRLMPATAMARASSPLAAGASNAPQTVLAIGDGSGFVFFMPRCVDGTVPTTAVPCGQYGAAVYFRLQMTPVNPALGPGISTTVQASSCAACSAWATTPYGSSLNPACMQFAQSLSPNPEEVLFCSGSFKGLPAPANVTVTLTAAFVGSMSAPGTVNVMLEPTVTPASIRDMYGVPSDSIVDQTSNTQAVAEFLGQFYAPSDLTQYLKMFNVTTVAPVTVTGPNNISNPGGEATLDIEVIMGVAPGSPTTFWSLAGLRNNTLPPSNSNQEPFLTWVLAVNDDDSAPLVHSISYSDDESAMPRAFTDRLNVEFMKTAMRGISLLFATGDDGVCSESVRNGPCTGFAPSFPPASPYVTAVGGTQFGRDANDVIVEVVANSQTGSFITSGGGFSNRYLMPQYQKSFVKSYLATTKDLPPATWFNASGRAYPDVSSISTNFLCIIGGFYTPIGGTSASTPTTAALITLLNEIRLDNGLPALGFLNPMLYAFGANTDLSAFHDVTVGINRCSAIPTNCCPYGFPAAVGWDASTGLGSLNFDALSTLIIPTAVSNVAVDTQSAAFTVSETELRAPGGVIGSNVTATVYLSGIIGKLNVVTGQVQYEIYEQGVSKFIAQGFSPYFVCNNKGCDQTQPVALHLQTPGVVPTAFTLSFDVVLPAPTTTGQFQMEVWGVDQFHTPYDFTTTIGYNITKA